MTPNENSLKCHRCQGGEPGYTCTSCLDKLIEHRRREDRHRKSAAPSMRLTEEQSTTRISHWMAGNCCIAIDALPMPELFMKIKKEIKEFGGLKDEFLKQLDAVIILKVVREIKSGDEQKLGDVDDFIALLCAQPALASYAGGWAVLRRAICTAENRIEATKR